MKISSLIVSMLISCAAFNMTLFTLPTHANEANVTGIQSDIPNRPQWSSASEAFVALKVLFGQWKGEGKGKWGHSQVSKQFAAILVGKVICRTGISVYPKQQQNPKGEVHKAHSLIALVGNGEALSLTEYDNEGFIADYRLNLAESERDVSWVFELVSAENLPSGMGARLRISAPVAGSYQETFELDFSQKGYRQYLINTLIREPVKNVKSGCAIQADIQG